MTTPRPRDRAATPGLRDLADQMFSRASGAGLREGNAIRLLKDAAENYPAWLDAIRGATQTIHVEMYIIHEDDAGPDVRGRAHRAGQRRRARAR